MKNKLLILQDKVLKLLADKVDDFYLSGGTALSHYYFQHRISEDLDFFTQRYNRLRTQEIINYLKESLDAKITLVAEQTKKKGMVKLAIYRLSYNNMDLKIDFVEDYLKLILPCKKTDGILVVSLPDIYLRKIYTIIGTAENVDLIGRRTISGRREAKDFYDLYFLSHTYKGLAEFAIKHCNSVEHELLIHWYRTYDRMNIKSGLLDLEITQKKSLDFKDLDNHFKKEIDLLLEKEIGKI